MKLQYDPNKVLHSAFTKNQKVVFDRNAISSSVRRQRQQAGYLLADPKRVTYTQGSVPYVGISTSFVDVDEPFFLFVVPIHD